MKIVIASDSFKGTMSSIEVCDIIDSAIKSVSPNISTIKIPVADGGEGLVEAILTSQKGIIIKKIVKGPNFDEVESLYGILEDNTTAIIEMAAASGIIIAKKNSNPSETTTYGTGELIIDAINRGCKKIILGIGGSATNDAGVGMADAFGVKFLNINGDEIDLNGGGLEKLALIDFANIDKRLMDVEILVACDVDNPLFGENGAAFVFAPQKGADKEMVKKLDNNLIHFEKILHKFTGKKIGNIPGTGAAGGIAACLLAFTNASIKPGIGIVLDCAKFDEAIVDADFVITGEGKIDTQSLRGKVAIGIAERAKLKEVPVIVIAGGIDKTNDEFYQKGISAIFSTTNLPEPFETMKPKCRDYLFETVSNIIRLILISRNET